jgi:hypothetical protein
VVLSETGDRALTDDDGHFSFGGVPRGPVTFVVRAGHRDQTTWPMTVPGGSYDLEV